MGRKTALAVVLFGVVTIGGCFGCSPKPLFPKDVCLKASPRLQWYEERAHSLYVRVYPLKTTDGFISATVSDLLADPPPLLPGSVGSPQSRMLHPDGTEKLTVDPPKENDKEVATHLGVVAGYYAPKGKTKVVLDGQAMRGDECYAVVFGPSGIESPDTPAAPGGKQ